MRGVVLLVLACAGCDGVFGINPVPVLDDAARATDGSVTDGTTSGALSIVLPNPPGVFVGDQVPLSVSVHGPADATVTMSALADVGSVMPAMAVVKLDANGLGTFDVTYTAPDAAGNDQLSFGAQDGTLTALQALPLTIHPLTSVGLDAMQGMTQPINASSAIGARVQLTSPATVRKVGFYATTAGAHAIVGIYNVMPTDPYKLQIASAPHVVTLGRNEIDVAPTPMVGGTYWIVVIFDAQTSCEYTTTGIYGTSTAPYASGMPATWNQTWVDVANTTFAFFMRIE